MNQSIDKKKEKSNTGQEKFLLNRFMESNLWSNPAAANVM